MPKIIQVGLLVLTLLALIPPFLIARAREGKSRDPRIHLIQDMDNQKRYKLQMVNPIYADSRAMRRPVADTVEYGDELQFDDHYSRGLVNGEFAKTFPSQINVDMSFVERGRKRFEIYCVPCHGYSGHGDGIVAQRAAIVSSSTWVQPTDLHKRDTPDSPVQRPDGYLFNVITHGVRNMPPYGPQIPVRDRWAIVAYVRALQLSEHASLEDVPAAERAHSSEWPVQVQPEKPK